MRWKLPLLAALLLLLFNATDSIAQQDVAVTVTVPATNHTIAWILFPDIDPTTPVQVGNERFQQKVGTVQWNEEERFQLRVRYGLGSSPVPFEETFSFDTEALCNEVDQNTGENLSEGELTRISCAVVERGAAGGVVCSALYEDMVDPAKVPAICTGTVACMRCGAVKVCGSDPQCY